ncbi:MAG: uncharacterized protein H6R10_1375 [Rhodocyclaceae bacterium]|nr:uncharacterized protein [Rhodocyclaceae bacterium]
MPAKTIKVMIPLMPGPEHIRPWLEIIHSNRFYTNFGPLVCRLEEQLHSFLAVESGASLTTIANATQGLEVALMTSGLPPASRILLPALTFAATATAIVRCGHRPVFADVDSATWLLTPDAAVQVIDKHDCAAVMPVAAFGAAQDSAEWASFSRYTDKPVIIDAAGAFGNQGCDRGVMTIFSLHATKSLGCGEGGLAVGPRDWVGRMRTASNFGLGSPEGIVYAGTNAKMSEYHAAVGLAAMELWSKSTERRRRLHQRYLRRLEPYRDRITTQQRPAGGIYTIFPVLLPPGTDVARVAAQMAEQGIETRRWYHPLLPDHPAFRGGAHAGELHCARDISERLIGLPFHPFLSDDDIETVIAVTMGCLDNTLRHPEVVQLDHT